MSFSHYSTQLRICAVWSAVSKASECLLSRHLRALLSYDHFTHFTGIDHHGKSLIIYTQAASIKTNSSNYLRLQQLLLQQLNRLISESGVHIRDLHLCCF